MKRKRIGKAVLSLTLVAAMCLPFTAGYQGQLVAAASTVWSGGTAAEYAGGQGTQEDPYQIATGEQLALLVQTDATATAGKYYVLTKDIRLNDTSAEDWKQSATPWVQSDVSFRGQLDGQGHVVEGLFIDADVTTTTRAGLFCFIGPGAVVKNVGIVKADLKAKFVGSIAAYIEHMDGTPPRISNCFAASSVKIQGADVGGLVGATPRPVCMEDSFFTGSLTATGKKGGLVGSLWGAADANNTVIRRCYVYGENRDSALGNVSTKMVLENVYATQGQTGVTELEPGHMIGDAAKTSMTGFDFDTVWRTVEGGTPQLLAFPLFDDTPEILVDYIVSIPSSLETITQPGEKPLAPIVCMRLQLEKTGILTVSATHKAALTHGNGRDTIPYALLGDNRQPFTSVDFVVGDQNKTQPLFISITQRDWDNASLAGVYSDTVTFTVSYDSGLT